MSPICFKRWAKTFVHGAEALPRRKVRQLSMTAQSVIDFAQAIKADPELLQLCASDQCADVDDQCDVAKQRGFDVHPHDFDAFRDGLLVEQSDEDSFLKPQWWSLI